VLVCECVRGLDHVPACLQGRASKHNATPHHMRLVYPLSTPCFLDHKGVLNGFVPKLAANLQGGVVLQAKVNLVIQIHLHHKCVQGIRILPPRTKSKGMVAPFTFHNPKKQDIIRHKIEMLW